jgi:small ligand-binding sensory domain FIST
MTCVTALSTSRDSQAAFQEIQEKLDKVLQGACADLTMIFCSTHHGDDLGRMSATLLEQGNTKHVLGCTGESIVGEDREVEGAPALVAWAIELPGVTFQPLRLGEPGNPALSWAQELEDPSRGAMLFLADPFSFRTDEFLGGLFQAARGLRVVGGMASGSQVPRGNQLVLDGEAFHDGAVAMGLGGQLALRTVVSQGCRPVGHTMIVTRAEQNIIRELGRRPALEALREVFENLSPEDQGKVQDGLFLGRVINEYQGSFRRGDFLIRNVVGADESGAIQITDKIRVGQTVQFHVRDAETAHEDLRENLLEQAKGAGRPQGALLFTCNGRGSRLFDRPDHDVRLIHEVYGAIPIVGFFAMGEIGPIGGQNFLHGYTASLAIFDQVD